MRIIGWLAVYIAAGLSWLAVWGIVVRYDIGQVDHFWSADRLAAYALFILAPMLTFLPIGKALRIPLYELEAVAAWSTLVFVIAFIDPGTYPSFPVLLLFLVSLTMALATLFTLVSYAVGCRLLTRRSQQYDFLRARREGYLISMFLVGLLLLYLMDVLTAINGALLALIVVLLEVFLLSRGTDRSTAQPVGREFSNSSSPAQRSGSG